MGGPSLRFNGFTRNRLAKVLLLLLLLVAAAAAVGGCGLPIGLPEGRCSRGFCFSWLKGSVPK